MKNFVLPLAAALAASAASFAVAPAFADGGTFVGTEGKTIAVSGYDAVSYFKGNGVPVKGISKYKVTYKDATYYFANAANAAQFKKNPAAFAPQYGGHCAWAMSRGAFAPGDPKLYKIVGGKLYLNFNPNVQKTWLSDISGFIAKADPKWKAAPAGKRFGS